VALANNSADHPAAAVANFVEKKVVISVDILAE
jgi:hypothetical protein